MDSSFRDNDGLARAGWVAKAQILWNPLPVALVFADKPAPTDPSLP